MLPARRQLWLSIWCIIAAFGTYFCMYAFRRPFTVGTYRDASGVGTDFKSLLVIAQVIGYMLSKFLSVRIVAEMSPGRRGRTILLLIVASHVALLLFAIVPAPFNIICLFLNGLPLGMVFGLVLGFLEGRRSTEALTAGLCASFILADGVMKSLGAWLLARGISEFWMPFTAGAMFLLPLFGFVAMLQRIPPPDARDVESRSERLPMSRDDRQAFLAKYGLGIGLIIAVYLLITILRSVRADFAPEIWKGLGVNSEPALFTQSEFWVMLGVIVINGSAVLIRDNQAAFRFALLISLGGALAIGVALIGYHQGTLSPFDFMVCSGLGLYVPYVAIHTTVFERLIALTRDRGNLGYLMCLADSVGYLGYVAVILAKTFGMNHSFADLFTTMAGIVAAISAVLLLVCLLAVRWQRREAPLASVSAAPTA